MENMISIEQFGLHVKNKKQLYKAFLSNGFFLPLNEKNQFISMKMLKDIYTGKCHCPKLSEIKFQPCCYPPSQEFLRDEVCTIIENGDFPDEEQTKQWKRLVKYMRKNTPEKRWLLGLLATISPGHEVFQKNYKPPTKQRN
jgi:hypothetical protein